MSKPTDSTQVPRDNVVTDTVFAKPRDRIDDFKFTRDVAVAFDDMVGRSVPFYDELQRMTLELTAEFAQPNTAIYDFGCATGTTFEILDRHIDPSVSFVGIDNSPEMLAEAEGKLAGVAQRRNLDLMVADLESLPPVRNASVAILFLTLQFVRPLHRERVMRQIAAGMKPGGAVILVEKTVLADSLLNRTFITNYLAFKRRQGYSDLEIAQKREALENVLIPYRDEENGRLMKDAGFARVEGFFRWYNFAGFIGLK